MSMSKFFKGNKKARENIFYPATESLCGEDGKPLLFEVRPISTKENDEITESCLKELPIPGKRGEFRQQLNRTLYTKRLAVTSIVSPNLLNAELQDSYGVTSAEELIQQLVDSPAEWNNLIKKINELNGFTTIKEDIEEAKN